MAIGLTFGLCVCGGLLLLIVVGRRHEPVRRRDDDATRVVHVTYNDNRQLTIAAMPHPQWPQQQGMSLIAHRQREIEHNGWLPPGHSGMRD